MLPCLIVTVHCGVATPALISFIGRSIAACFPHDVAERAAARYADYKQGKVDETEMCGEMVTINAGNSLQTLEEAAEEFFSSIVEKRIFPEMLRLTRELESQGCEVWAVSSTNDWVVREGVKRFGIPRRRVLAASVHIDDGQITDRLIRVPSGPGKATAIAEVVKKPVDVCFGNSVHDAAMLEIARHAFAVNPNPDWKKSRRKKAGRFTGLLGRTSIHEVELAFRRHQQRSPVLPAGRP